MLTFSNSQASHSARCPAQQKTRAKPGQALRDPPPALTAIPCAHDGCSMSPHTPSCLGLVVCERRLGPMGSGGDLSSGVARQSRAEGSWGEGCRWIPTRGVAGCIPATASFSGAWGALGRTPLQVNPVCKGVSESAFPCPECLPVSWCVMPWYQQNGAESLGYACGGWVVSPVLLLWSFFGWGTLVQGTDWSWLCFRLVRNQV